MHPIVDMLDVSVVRGDKTILDNVSWQVLPGEHWVILGANGAGKTSILQLLHTNIFPTTGLLQLFDEILGLVDIFELRPRIGFTSASLLDTFPENESVIEVVKTAAYSMFGTWQESYELPDTKRANNLLADWGIGDLGLRQFKSLSEGEKKRTLIARALMPNPELLLLDEPAAGLDISGRESMVRSLSDFVSTPTSPVCILVTHHVEEIPEGFTHLMCLKNGKVVAKGPIQETLTSQNLTETFGLPLEVSSRPTSKGNRWSVRLI